MNWSDYRDRFPVTRERVFLNHAAISAPSVDVVEVVREFMVEHARLGSQGYPLWMERVAEVRQNCAALIGARSTEIAFVPNTSTGLSLIAEAFPWRAGDAVLVPTPDFPANVFPWQHLARHGVETIWVPRQQGRLRVDDFASALTPAVRMLVASSVDFASGHALDLRACSQFCQSHNIVFGVDAIQSLGVLPVDVGSIKIDFLVAGAHKWLMGPTGIALLYVASDLLPRLTPALVGWKSVISAERFDRQFVLREDCAVFEPGTLNLAGIFGLGTAIGLLQEIGIDQVADQVATLVTELMDGLVDRGMVVHTPSATGQRAGILSFSSNHDDRRLFAYLHDNAIVCALREGALRLSPHFYNNNEDLARFFHALDRFSEL